MRILTLKLTVTRNSGCHWPIRPIVAQIRRARNNTTESLRKMTLLNRTLLRKQSRSRKLRTTTNVRVRSVELFLLISPCEVG